MEKVSRNILLKQVREERGWTQRRLADELGVSEQTVRTWERGTRSPLLEHRTRLSEIFGRTSEQLGLSPLNDIEPSPHNEVSPLLSDSAVVSSPTTEGIERDNHFSIVPHAPARPVFHQIDQNRQRMLTRVRSRWITGVLENSLYHETLIVLGLQEHPNAVANPWHLTVQESNLPSRPLPVGTRITDVYDDVNGELLILGEPGAGKTTLLLELAQELLDRAEADETHPIPVVFNLASWTERFHASLASWIVEELTTKYQVPHALGRKWIETNTLLLLLDGLDEVEQSRRSACIEAINAYHESHHLVSIVVCSRESEYMAQAKRIALQRAVMVQLLTTEQIDDYLSSAGKEMEAIRSTLRDDLELRALVETPLMLSVFTLAYHGRSGEELRTQVSSEARRKQVFATYVQRMLVRRTAETRYTPQETMSYLAWLAHDMHAHSQTEFFIERMQPDCLQDNLSSYRHYRVTVIRVVFGIATFVGAGILASFRGDMYPSQPGLFYWVGGGVGNSVLGWMAPGLGGELKGATCLGLIQAIVTVIVTVLGDRRELPLVTGKALRRGLFSILRYSVLVGVIVAIFASLVFIWADGWSYGLFQGGEIGLFGGLTVGLMNGLITLLRATSAEEKEKTLQKRHSPLTFKERLFNAFIFSVCAGSGFASIHAMQSGGIDQYVVSYGLIAGFFYGLLFGVGNGIDLVHELGITIQPAETVSWSWQTAWRAGRESIQKGCVLGVTIMVEVILVIAVISSIFNGWKYGLRFGIIFGLIVGLIAGVASILTGILIRGWSSDTISDNHQFVQPNEGIRRSMSHAAFAALIFGPIGGIASGLMSGFSFGLGGIAGWYILGTGFMIVFGIIFAFHFLTLYGGIACVEHYVLRWFLWRKGAIPFNYVRFLDYASERILLRKVGGGYMFIHQLLLDYFVSLEGHEHSTLKKQVTQATGKGKNVQG